MYISSVWWVKHQVEEEDIMLVAHTVDHGAQVEVPGAVVAAVAHMEEVSPTTTTANPHRHLILLTPGAGGLVFGADWQLEGCLGTCSIGAIAQVSGGVRVMEVVGLVAGGLAVGLVVGSVEGLVVEVEVVDQDQLQDLEAPGGDNKIVCMYD